MSAKKAVNKSLIPHSLLEESSAKEFKPSLRMKIGGLKEEQYSVVYCSSSQETTLSSSSSMSDNFENDQVEDEMEEESDTKDQTSLSSATYENTFASQKLTALSLVQIVNSDENDNNVLTTEVDLSESDSEEEEDLKKQQDLVMKEGDSNFEEVEEDEEETTNSPENQPNSLSDIEFRNMALAIVNRQEMKRKKQQKAMHESSFDSVDGSAKKKKKLTQNMSTKTTNKKTTKKRFICPAKGCDSTLASANGLRRHKLRAHICLKPFFCHFGVAQKTGKVNGSKSGAKPPCSFTAYARHEVLHHVMKEHHLLKYEDADKHIFGDPAILKQIEQRMKKLV